MRSLKPCNLDTSLKWLRHANCDRSFRRQNLFVSTLVTREGRVQVAIEGARERHALAVLFGVARAAMLRKRGLAVPRACVHAWRAVP